MKLYAKSFACGNWEQCSIIYAHYLFTNRIMEFSIQKSATLQREYYYSSVFSLEFSNTWNLDDFIIRGIPFRLVANY